MADISLKAYLEKVDTLLKTGKYDEVIAHSQHILKHFPRNVGANRLLGQALAQGTRAEESKTILRRVLAAYPDDVSAHVSLSEASERTGKPDEAIWHMERAFEQTPGDKRLLERLRGLYQRHRGIENPKLQLTTSAVARQYVRNGLFNQAIETLRATLERSPKRVDLRLLLAQTLWTAGKEVESAETALDVLETLPYCVEANHILTTLWLDEGRPSDAQRYLEQIQEVEPYLALHLAQNADPDDDAFQLAELDYQRIAEANLASAQPDWLMDIDEQPEKAADIAGMMPGFDEDESADDLVELGEESEIAPPQATGRTGMTGLLTALDNPDDEAEITGELPDWLDEEAPSEAVSTEFDSTEIDSGDLEDALDWLQDDDLDTEAADGDLPDFFAEAETEANVEIIDDDADPLTWLASSGVELADEDELPDLEFAGDDISSQGAIDDDSLAWLEGSGVELADENELPEPEFVNDDEMSFRDPSDADPLAWLEGGGVEVAEDTQDEPVPLTDAENEDALAWLEGDESGAPDFFGGLGDEETAPTDEAPQTTEGETVSDDSLDWLSDDSMLDEFLDFETFSVTESPLAAPPESSDEVSLPAVEEPGALSGEPQEPAEVELDWQDTMAEQDKPQAEQPESGDSGDVEWESSADGSGLDWLAEDSDEEAEWLTEDSTEIEIERIAGGEPGWLAEDTSDEVDSEFSWLDEADEAIEEMGTAVTAELGNADLEWLSGDDTDDDGEAKIQPAADMPDWFSDAAPVSESETEAEPVAETDDSGDSDWMADEVDETEIVAETTELADDDGFGWLGGDDANDGTEAQPAADMPDWLSDATAVSESETEAVPDDSGDFDWIADEADKDVEAHPAADMPDWLSEAAPVAEDDTSTITDLEGESEEFGWSDQGEPVTDTPDWLSEVAAVSEETDEASEEDDWAKSEEVEPVADMPNWLSEAAPVAEEDADTETELVAEPDDSGDFDWIADEADEDVEAQPAADMPNWLSEAAPVAEDDTSNITDLEGEAEEFDWSGQGEPVTDTPDWLSEVAAVNEETDEASEEDDWAESEKVEPVADMPDWLSEAASVAEDDTNAITDLEGESEEFDWSDQGEPVTDTPDWLSEVAAVSEETDEANEEDDWAESEKVEPVADMPDWLSDAAPVSESETEAEPDDSGDFDWMADEDVEAQPAADMPDWLSEAAPVAETEVEEEYAETLDWSDELEEAEADIPDWLVGDEVTESQEQIEAEARDDFEETDAGVETSDDFAWSAGEAVAETEPAPDWSADDDGDAEFDLSDDEALEFDADPAHSTFGWLDDGEDEQAFAEEPAETAEIAGETLSPDELDMEKALAAADSPPPASNAPDWLNAMVPGLDLDYEATEDDKPLDTGYDQSPMRREQPEVTQEAEEQGRNFDWLVEIVDEETGPIAPITDVAETPRRQRFVFTRQPAWLRVPTESDDDSNDDDDFELPEWLQ